MQKLDLLLQYLSHFVLLVRELVFRQTVSFYVSIWNERNRLTNASRENISDASLLQILKHTWEFRTDRYSDERTAESTNKRQKVEMSYIGG